MAHFILPGRAPRLRNYEYRRKPELDAASIFAKQFAAFRYEQLPAEVIDAVKKQILDYIGVAMGGACQTGANEIRELTLEMGGAPHSMVFGTGDMVPAPNAAQSNATDGHCLDFDDVHEEAVMHPGVVTIPTSFAMADYVGGISGKDLIAAVALGGDMISRLGLATRPGENIHQFGWHFTTLNGFVTAAAVAGRILGFDAEKINYAMGIGYHQACGNGQAVKDGAHTKRLGPGFACRGGIYAAMLAAKGVTGATNIFEGLNGFFKVYHEGHYSRDILVGELGERWESLNISIKPYPCCRGVHPAIDCALRLREEFGVTPENLDKLVIALGEGPTFLLCTPLEAKKFPRNVVDAQFSIPWGASVAISRGAPGLKDYTAEAIQSQDILDITAKVVIETDTSLNSTGLEPVRMTAYLKDGSVKEVYTDTATGSPDQPISFEQSEVKFRMLVDSAEKRISKENEDKVIAMVKDLENISDIRDLIRLLVWEENEK